MELMDPQLSDRAVDDMSPAPRAAPFPALDDDSPTWIFRKVSRVVIETSNSDATPNDPCWLLVDADDQILFVVASGTALTEEMIDRLGDSRGFDKAEMRRAMRSTQRARFTVWQRDMPLERASTLH
jgi:hypothetical protein